MIEVEIEETIDYKGFEIKACIVAEASIYTEVNYGANLDGLYGKDTDFMDDFNLQIFDQHGKELTNKLMDRDLEEYRRLEKIAEEKLYDSFLEARYE